MKVIGNKIICQVMEYTNMLMVLSIGVNGKIINSMVEANTNLLMVLFLKDNGLNI
jgi:hypothetical protein